jgi:large repetitive protein
MKNLFIFASLIFSLFQITARAQAPTCSPLVPFYSVDLRGNPTGTWISPGHSRADHCCSATGNDRCTSFEIYLDTGAAMVSFEIASGAIPSGSMYYQINCGPQIAVGQPICIAGPGPHYLTFCKPGNNNNTYRVTSIAKPTFPPPDTVRIGCSSPVAVLGMVESSVTWNSIFPGAPGAYNSYLSCTMNCDTALYTPASNAPPMVEYLVCGTPTATSCGYVAVCDTVRIYNQQALTGSVTPNPAGFCQGGPGVNLTASASGD